jgi:pectate lyase
MKKLVLFFTLSVYCIASSFSYSLTITESGGWFETVYAKWLPTEEADSYNVYYSGEGLNNKKADTQLIRNYGSYYRVDVPGLKAGNYTLKVVAVVDGNETTESTTGILTVIAFDRTGFTFSNGRIPGAYKADGTPKDNAVIIYITESTKNTISMEVTGANANPCVGLQAIIDGFKKGKDNRPLIVRIIGQITDPADLYNGDIVIENSNNSSGFITIEGIGDDAVADGWGIRIKNASNIEIRNIGTMNCNSSEGDNIGLQQENDYIWVHHCDFFYGHAGSDGDQAKGDGALDCKRSTYVTFSYNHFWDTGKSNLVGLSESSTSGLFITFHHNWFDHSDSRHPRVRFYSAHVYNNYYDGISKYGVGSTMGSSVFVEANYFRNCKYPMLTSMQGSDVYDESKQANDYTNMPTFSKEDGGTIKAFNNYMTGQRRFVAYGASGFPNSTVDFDAYMATSREETVPSTVISYRGSNIYNNFDTNPSVMYAYTPDSPEAARDKVVQFAGRMHGGDFKWTFNNAVDDTSYDVNPALKSALTSYRTKLVSIQGEDTPVGGGDDNNGGGDNNGTINPGTTVHNFTLSGKTSSYFNITGNLSDSKGTVNYAGLVLSICLKIESSTSVSFSTTKEAIVTLIFNDGFNGKIRINGTDYNASNGVLTVTLNAGNHVITKADTCNLYYIGVQQDTTSATDIIRDAQIRIYPNPVTDQIHVLTDSPIKRITLFNLTGAMIIQAEGNNAGILDVDHLNSGTYLIRTQTTERIYNQKIIKK